MRGLRRLEGIRAQTGILEPCLPNWPRHAMDAYLAAGRTADAERVLAWLDEITPRLETSSHHAASQIAAVRILVSPGLTADHLRQAGGRLDRLALDEARRQQLTVEILRAALDWDRSGQRLQEAASGDGLILGCEPDERGLRIGLERAYRTLARLTPDQSRRIGLVDMANAIRPLTWT